MTRPREWLTQPTCAGWWRFRTMALSDALIDDGWPFPVELTVYVERIVDGKPDGVDLDGEWYGPIDPPKGPE